MTEDQIERRIERFVDHLDRVYLAGQISREDYDKAMRDLAAWADAQRRLPA